MEYPYQIVAFLDAEPEKGQLIYGDENGGWLAQVALKRRFALKDINEAEFVQQLRKYYESVPAFEIKTSELQKPERMPVEIIPVLEPSAATKFHQDFLKRFGGEIISKYPDREGENYFPHVTAQYWEKYVIDVPEYQNKNFTINSVWLVKDVSGEQNTQAHERIALKTN